MSKTLSIQISKIPSNLKGKIKPRRDLEERLQNFFLRVIRLCKNLPINAVTQRIVSQVVAAAGSIPANYAEASEALSKKDFIKSIKICRKEAKETRVWLNGLREAVNSQNQEFAALIQEATEFIYILTSILIKVEKK